MKCPHYRTLLGAALAAAAAACAESTGTGGGTPTGDLNFLLLANAAPALCNDSAGAWFVKDSGGGRQEIALSFPENGATCGSGSTHDFLRLRIGGSSLQRRPDSTLIKWGDSVFISVKWAGRDSILFDLKPTGLLFDPLDPAELRIEYDECGSDLNRDGRTDSEDDDVETRLDIWRQERPGDPFVRVGTARSEENKEIDAKLNGFSRYAIAY
jgi:hypothetical protein